MLLAVLLLPLCLSTQGNLFLAANAFLLICVSASACICRVGAPGGSPAPHAHVLWHVYQVDSTPTWWCASSAVRWSCVCAVVVSLPRHKSWLSTTQVPACAGAVPAVLCADGGLAAAQAHGQPGHAGALPRRAAGRAGRAPGAAGAGRRLPGDPRDPKGLQGRGMHQPGHVGARPFCAAGRAGPSLALQPLADGCQVTPGNLRASGSRHAPARTCWRATGPRGRPRWAQSGAAAAGCRASADLGLGICGVRRAVMLEVLAGRV